MKIQPVSSPAAVQQPQGNTQAMQDSRARAIARLAEQPVPNANQVSAEELGAIRQQPSGHTDKGEEQVDTAPEVVEEPKTPSPKEDPQQAALFAKLARQEKAIRQKAAQQEQAFQAREQAIAAREAELQAKSTQYTPERYLSRDELKSNTLQALIESGVPLEQAYEQLTQQILNPTQTDPRMLAQIRALEAKLQKMEEAAQKGQEQSQQAQQAQYQQAVKQIETEARSLIKQDPAFEMVKATNSVKDVVELITETFNKDGILLSVEEAAQQVEDYLTEEAEKLTKIDKIKKRIAANSGISQQVQKAQAAPSQQTKQSQPMKTLTNATGSSRQLSARERALLAFKGELK